MNPIRKNRLRFSLTQGKQGFTLIELLVVIAIISLLAAILFPVFAQAREKGRATSCLNNLKQLSVASLQYIQDYDETCPLTYLVFDSTSDTNGYGFWTVPLKSDPPDIQKLERTLWAVALQPYVKSYAIYACPSSDDDYNNAIDASIPTLDDANSFRSSYLINGYLNAWPISKTASPARVIAFSEAIGKQAIVGEQLAFPLPLTNEWPPKDMPEFIGGTVIDKKSPSNDDSNCTTDKVAGRYTWIDFGFPFANRKTWFVHGKGSNYAYMDGHVKWVANPGTDSTWYSLPADGKPDPATSQGWGVKASTGYCGTWFYQYGPVQ